MHTILTRSVRPNFYDPTTGDTLRDDFLAPFQTAADALTAFRNSRNPRLKQINEPVIRLTLFDSLRVLESCQQYYADNHDFPVSPAIMGKILGGGWVREHHAFELMDALGMNYSIEEEDD